MNVGRGRWSATSGMTQRSSEVKKKMFNGLDMCLQSALGAGLKKNQRKKRTGEVCMGATHKGFSYENLNTGSRLATVMRQSPPQLPLPGA